MSDIKHMNITEFRKEGFLQEANRTFFHPLGLALEVIVDDNTGEERLGGVWDHRDDPEGIMFSPLCINQSKIDRVNALRDSKAEARIKIMGEVVQSR